MSKIKCGCSVKGILFKGRHIRFTPMTFKPLLDQLCGIYRRFFQIEKCSILTILFVASAAEF